jgi:hypothetical protein
MHGGALARRAGGELEPDGAAGLLGLPVVKRWGRVLCAMVEPSGDESGSDKEVLAPSADGAAAVVDSSFKSRRDMLQEYVKNVQPEFMERFVQKAPAQVVEAIRRSGCRGRVV